MDRTLTALFDSRKEAEQARERLVSLGLNSSDIGIHDQSASSAGLAARDGTGGHGKGFLGALMDLFLPHEDSRTYEEGLRRGHALLTVRAADGRADEVERELNRMNAVDIEARSREWEQSGWQKQQPETQQPETMAGRKGDGMQATAGTASEQRIPIVEEQLRVGKREVTRGGARVRSYVVETPVHDQVRLREERTTIERRPVDKPATDPDRLFQEREIDVTETAEEAVVGKEARVREEVVVRKEAQEHTEDIDDTVRHTEVEVDDHLAHDATKKQKRDQRPRPRP